MTLEYTIDVDYATWIPVPLSFPWNEYETAMSWAADVTADLLSDRSVPDEVRTAFAATALERAVMPPPLPEAIERFWRRPDDGAPDRLVHLYAIDAGEPSLDDLVEYSRAGIGGFVQSVFVLEDTRFTIAARVSILLEMGETTVAVVRTIGSRDGTALMLELIDDNIAAVAFLEPDIETLFRSIRLRTV